MWFKSTVRFLKVVGDWKYDARYHFPKKQKELPFIVAVNARSPHEVSEYRFSYNISGLIDADVAQLAGGNRLRIYPVSVQIRSSVPEVNSMALSVELDS